jgi:hypothetical protein
MPNYAKIQIDAHSPWVRTNGGLYRPIPAVFDIGCKPVETQYTLGERVLVYHLSQSTKARVGKEIWFYHGPSYFDELLKTHGTWKFRPTEEIWDPAVPRVSQQRQLFA